MKTHRLLLALSIANAAILLFSLAHPHCTAAQDVVPVIRGRALEIVDEHGHVRAEIRVTPAQPTLKMPDGTTGYPETVLLRLIDSKGAPNVKIAATEDGSVVSFAGESNPTYVQILARGTNTSLKLVNNDGREQVIKP